MSLQLRRVLIIQEKIPHYRLDLFNQIAQLRGIELTLAAVEMPNPNAQTHFQYKQIETTKWRGFIQIKGGFKDFCTQFDVVIAMFNVRWVSLIRLAFSKKRTFKLLFWGIGVSSDGGYDMDKRFDWLRFAIARRADGLIFYSDYPVKKYHKKGGIPITKMTVAHNTISIHQKEYNPKLNRDRFLFVGTLYKSKKIFELLDAYKLAHSQTNNLPELDIIGNGSEFDNIKSWANKENLTDKIHLHGSITGDDNLLPFFERAIACISPGQAGLSVLTSLAFGVPFITRNDSITGGERFNVRHQKTGFLYDSMEELSDLLVRLHFNRSEANQMGHVAHKFYAEHRTMPQMVKSFEKIIKN